tara:strand:- start:3225 stop:3341 length:117 start_codon:yes stop_codon:yes gene_type:complete
MDKKNKKVTFTRTDEMWEYFKLIIIILIGLGYMYILWF